MNNSSRSVSSNKGEPKTGATRRIESGNKKRKPKAKIPTASNSLNAIEGEDLNVHDSKTRRQKTSSKIISKKSNVPIPPLLIAQGGATSSKKIKMNKKAKKRAEEEAKNLPSTSQVFSGSGNRSKSENSNSKKNLVYYCSSYKGLPAFKNLQRTPENIWQPPEKVSVEEDDSNIEEVSTFDSSFDIEIVHKPPCGRFIRKRSSNKNVNYSALSKSPVLCPDSPKKEENPQNIESHQEKEQSLNMICNKFNKLQLDSSLVTNTSKSSSLQLEDSFIRNVTDKEESAKSNNSPKSPKKSRRSRYFRPRSKKNVKKDLSYPNYISLEEVTQGLDNGSLIKGFIRINPRNTREAYVSSMTKGDCDYVIKSLLDQNRALEGDEVILRIKPKTEWDGGRKTAYVVFISKMIHPRTAVGKLSPLPKNENFAEFVPRDKKFPDLHIPSISWPTGFKTNPKSFEKNIFLAKITEWINLDYAKGLIIENVGISGDLKVENLAILKSCCLDYEPFSNDMLKYLPKTGDLQDEWLEGREDLRKECVFTIDPLTARDLDDAVSCKTLPDGNLEVGVHIADVSFFLKEGTELDKQVAWKATTIYMVSNVYHMLPVELCMNCSLLPGKDRLSFSVFWIMTPEGEILNTRFSRTVMNSCVQLAYEHAQAVIDDPENFDRSSIPKITNGYTVEDATDIILKLYRISKNLRQKRFENGALRIDQVKLSYQLDPATGYPEKYYVQEMKEANRLIEEFMLLANISVAKKTLEHFPSLAFLRMHEPPKENMLVELKRALGSVGIHVNITSAKSIQSSLLRYGSDDRAGKIRSAVLSYLFAKSMTRAIYFCAGIKGLADSFNHYALNVPLYTHFTSPIRRYPDVMVHRLLAASLGLADPPNISSEEVGEIAARCNMIKYNAKKAQEESSKLYLCHYIVKNQPFIREAAVVEVRERSFDVIVLECGEVVRIHLHEILDASYNVEDITNIDLDSDEQEQEMQKKYWRITFQYPKTKEYPAHMIVIELFTLVQVLLQKCAKTHQLVAKLVRPNS